MARAAARSSKNTHKKRKKRTDGVEEQVFVEGQEATPTALEDSMQGGAGISR